MKAILFDFDGTIIDSQGPVNNAVGKFLAKKNIFLNEEEKGFLAGMSITDFTKLINKTKNTNITEEDININSEEVLSKINLFPHARKTLALLKSRGYKIALVTNSPRNYVNTMFNKLSLGHYFDTTITVDESSVAKPNPKMLEMACEKLNVKHKNCVMIDDNSPGIIAGKALGMMTVRISKATRKNNPQREKEKANHVVNDVSELPDLLEKIHFTRL